jgi:glyoxylase-like metal-dependent hydrolase (beta-lactamase superfamily II)
VPLRLADATARALRAHEPIGLYRRIVWGRRTRLTTSAEPFVTDAFALIHSPGHSHDHHVVLDRETGTLFAGDLFLGVKVRMAHHDEDPRLLAASLRDVARLAPARMFDAHRGLVDKPVEMLTAKADWLDETIARIEARIAQGWSDRAITRDVLGAEEAEHYVSFGDLSRINFVRQVRASSGA